MCASPLELDHVHTEVAGRHAALAPLSWPDPQPERGDPPAAAYSRVTDPGRYRIVTERARIWADVLREVLGATVEPLAPAPLDEEMRFDRGVRIRSPRPETLPLLLLERDVALTGGEGTMTVLHIGVVLPTLGLASYPDCGCDACDYGSEDLLGAIDQTLLDVVGGPFVVMRGRGWLAHWSPDGGGGMASSRRGPGFDKVLETCRRLSAGEPARLPRGAEAYVGQPWTG